MGFGIWDLASISGSRVSDVGWVTLDPHDYAKPTVDRVSSDAVRFFTTGTTGSSA
jgi:hypothetical protein